VASFLTSNLPSVLEWRPARIYNNHCRMAREQWLHCSARFVCPGYGSLWLRRPERGSNRMLVLHYFILYLLIIYILQLYMFQYLTPDIIGAFAGFHSSYLIGQFGAANLEAMLI
jgi:hypothetical protein